MFTGFYEIPSTSGAAVAAMIEDVLVRFSLSLDNLRGMSFDGAANMSGKYNGAQAILRQKQPLAHFFHCRAHCVNLVLRDCISVSRYMRDALLLTNEVGVVYSESIKFRQLIPEFTFDSGKEHNKLRPLCPTRFTYREKAVSKLLGQHEEVLAALEALSTGPSHASTRAHGLYIRMQDGFIRIFLENFPTYPHFATHSSQ